MGIRGDRQEEFRYKELFRITWGEQMVTDELAITQEIDYSMQGHSARRVLLPMGVCIPARTKIDDQIAEFATM